MVAKQNSTPRKGFGRRAVPAIAGVAVIALVGTLAVFVEGYDTKEIPALETSVWVTRDAGQYARVNTDLGEIDTVRSVADPVGVAQSGPDAVVFSSGYRQLWSVDAANPLDLTAAESAAKPAKDADGDGTEGGDTGSTDTGSTDTGSGDTDGSDAQARFAPGGPQNTPVGTREVLSAGNFLVYLTDSGAVLVSSLTGNNGRQPIAFPVNPFASLKVNEGEERPVYSASAVALSPEGRVLLYSSDDVMVRTFDAQKNRFVGDPSPVQNPPDADARVELADAGDSWALSSPGDGEVWLPDQKVPVETGLGGGAKLQLWSHDAQAIHLADEKSLVSIAFDSGDVKVLAEGNGVPAAPTEVDGVVYAAWMGTAGGSLWSSATGSSLRLQVEDNQLDDVQVVVPRFYHNGVRAVLSEQATGLLWTVPDGHAIPIDQWDLGDDDYEAGTVEVDDLPQQEPPVAVADTFGVRAGRLVSLPVLLNDHDPNKKDVLSIVPDSISEGLSDSAFGQLGLVGNDQTAVVQVKAATGSATFAYAVTDGKAKSAPATVTLTIIPDSINTAPEWCPVEGCVQVWPTPKISAGGTAIVPVMDGWLDLEGDPIVLVDVRKVEASAPVSVVPLSDGSVAIRHNDANAGASVIMLSVVVSDSRGAVTEKELEISVGTESSIMASPVAVTASVGHKVTVKIADHVTGGSGAYRVLDAVQSSSNDGGLIVAPNAAAGTVDVSAAEPGEYIVTYSVQDAVTLSENSSLIRLTVVPGGAPLSMAPLTAFVRANEDTTVDVLGAVQNTTGRVLLVESASSSTPTLNVSVVAQSRLRVSGTTPDEQPGFIGTAKITVSDGGGSFVDGEVSVFLVPSAFGVAPIAVPDSATVRAGTQVDIPVLRNDLSPRGERLVVHPRVQGSDAPGELAFASGSSIRYLAPTVPGVYTISYSVYLEGRPDRVDTADVAVTVIAVGSNRPPDPPVLSARANAGQSVLIPVESYGMDPDGDRVTLIDVELPKSGQGVPTISADGTAIVYAAPAGGVAGGQVSFEYTVRDSNGATGVGRVRVGVISASHLDLTPVTYSDYVQVLRGSPTPVTVMPLLNDRDPAQGALEIIGLRPNAPGDSANPEYARLEALIDSDTSLEDGEIVLRAGSTLGTHSFVYTVQSSVSTSTAEGLIVVAVAESVAPDMPVVTDTVLTAKDRTHLAAGIDVVSGSVRWASGDVSGLTLSIWGQAADRYRVSGSRISGELPSRGDLVPFALTGADSAGAEVVAHGFLRIPAFDDFRVQVKPKPKHFEVNEEKSLEFDVRELLDLDTSDSIEIKSDSAFVVQRRNATCEPLSGTLVRYNSGREAPWSDTCAFLVRLKGQKQWSTVAIPVSILPKDPQAILSTISRTLKPGEAATIDLYDSLTTWEGGRVGDRKLLDYSAAFSGTAFEVQLSGSSLTITTRADAAPGTREAVHIGVSNFGGITGGVTLVVGIAPPDAPRGATFSQQCTVSSGASCAITVVDVEGEYDPFAGKLGGGLKVVGVGTGTSLTCPVATVTVNGEKQVTATWPAGPRPVGGECIVPMTVVDAQGRTGPGKLTIDVLGYPQIPSSLMTKSYSGSSVSMSASLGEAGQAHPGVTSVVLYEGGSPALGASCMVDSSVKAYSCTVSGLVNGAPHLYSARAVNSIGESLDTSQHQTWAYKKPEVISFVALSVYDAARTSESRGAVDLTIKGTTDTIAFRVLNIPQDFSAVGGEANAKISLEPGARSITVVPISQFRPPIDFTGTNGLGDEYTAIPHPVSVVGSPSYTSTGAASSTTTSVTLSGPHFDPNGGSKGEERFVAWPITGPEPVCSMVGGVLVLSGGTGHASSTITVPTEGIYRIKACSTNRDAAGTVYGYASSLYQQADTYPMPGDPAGTFTYAVKTTDPSHSGNEYRYKVYTGPSIAADPGMALKYDIGGTIRPDFVLSDSATQLRVQQCWSVPGVDKCSGWTSITPAGGSAPTTVTVTVPAAEVPEANLADYPGFSASCGTNVCATISHVLGGPGSVTYTVKFKNPYQSLDDITYTTSYVPTPPPDPDPDPDPIPDP